MSLLPSLRNVEASPIPFQAASLLAHEILEQVVETSDGGIAWPSAAAHERESSAATSSFPLADGLSDLYSGNPGVAIFLAAYARVTGDLAARDLCLRALVPLRGAARDSPARGFGSAWRSTQGAIGGLVGMGSWIYALLSSGKLLGDDGLITEAHELSSLMTPDRIAADPHGDLVFGAAGALLILLSLAELKPGPNRAGFTPLELAGHCSRRLLNAPSGLSPAASVEPKASSRFGLSHGLAGIVLALGRYSRRTGDPEVTARLESLTTTLLRATGPDSSNGFALPSPQRGEVSWCHGVSGLAVAWTELLKDTERGPRRPLLQAARHRALELAGQPRLSPNDHLCCGNFGRVAALLHAAEEGGDEGWSEAGWRLAHLTLRVAKTRQGFRLDYPTPDASLFRGLSGIAYTLLSFAAPGELPHLIGLE